MSARPIASLLAHLDSGATRRSAAPAADHAMIEAAADAARRAGYAEGLAEGERRLAQDRLRREGELAEAIARAREAWIDAEGSTLADRIDAAFEALEQRLVEGCAAALRPLVEAAARDAIVARFADDVRRLLAGAEDGPPLRIVGPEDLLSRIRARLGDSARMQFETAAAGDVVARLGKTTIETRFAAWSERLTAAGT